MKVLSILSSLFFLLILSSCAQDEQSSGSSATADASSSEISSAETADQQSDLASSAKSGATGSGLQIMPEGIGAFRVGARLDTSAIPAGARINAFNVNSTDAAGNKTKNKVNIIVKDGVNLFTLEMKGNTDVITKVTIPGNSLSTPEGITVGNLIGDFVRAYPLYEIYLDNDEYRVELTTPNYPKTLFLIDPNGYNSDREKLRSGKRVKLDFTDFLEVTEITDIIYKAE